MQKTLRKTFRSEEKLQRLVPKIFFFGYAAEWFSLEIKLIVKQFKNRF